MTNDKNKENNSDSSENIVYISDEDIIANAYKFPPHVLRGYLDEMERLSPKDKDTEKSPEEKEE